MRFAARHHEQGIWRVDHNEVLDADERDNLAGRCVHEVAACIHPDRRRPFARIALRILLGELPGGRPAADITPAEITGDDANAGRALHHAVVDRDALHTLIGVLDDGGLVACGTGRNLRKECCNLGQMLLNRLHDGVGAEEELPAIPKEVSSCEKLFGLRLVGLLDEARDLKGLACLASHFDVAVARLGARRLDADGDERAVTRCAKGLLQGVDVGRLVGDEVVCGEHREDGVFVAAQCVVRGPGHAGRGVLRTRLGEDILVRHMRHGSARWLCQMLARHDEHALGRDERLDA